MDAEKILRTLVEIYCKQENLTIVSLDFEQRDEDKKDAGEDKTV